MSYKEIPCGIDCPVGGDYVLGKGSESPDIVYIAEGPGEVERELQEPFAGVSGGILHQTQDPFLKSFETNSYLCFPDKIDTFVERKRSFRGSLGQGTKKGAEAKQIVPEEVLRTCKRRLIKTLEDLKPKVIVAMGSGAIQALLGSDKVLDNLWKPQSSPYLSFPHTVVCTFNPASPLRNPEQYRTFADCLELAARLAKGEIIGIQEPKTKIAENLEDVKGILEELKEETTLGLDLETTRLDPYLEDILTLVLSPQSLDSSYKTYIIPWRLITYKENDIQQPGEGFVWVRDWLESKERKFVVHNATFDQNFLRAQGIEIKIEDDPMLLHYALDERTGFGTGHGLKALAAQYLGMPDWEAPVWTYLKNKNDSFANVPEEVLHKYCRWDTPAVLGVGRELKERATEEEYRLYKNQLLPFRETLAKAQARGIWIDIKTLARTREEIAEELIRLGKVLEGICGLPGFNPSSPNQVQDILFKDWGMQRPMIDDIDTSGTGRPVLMEMLRQNQGFLKGLSELEEEGKIGKGADIPEAVQAATELDERFAFLLGVLFYRTERKDISTYLNGVAKFVSPLTHCIHPFYHVTGTETGRFTGSRPSVMNVKNKPRDLAIYAARPGFKLAYADQSQFELRVFAAITKDEKLREMLGEQDIHSAIGHLVFPFYDESPAWWRQIIKTIVYGVLYGRSAYAIAKKHGIPLEDAESYRNQVLNLFPKIAEYEERILAELRENQVIKTRFGRQRRFPFLPPERKRFIHIKNAAGNFPIQSMASDINAWSMHDMWQEAKETNIYPLFPVHDSIISEIPENRIEESKSYIKRTMEGAAARHLGEDFNFIEWIAKPKIGNNWGDMMEEEPFFAQVRSLIGEEEEGG